MIAKLSFELEGKRMTIAMLYHLTVRAIPLLHGTKEVNKRITFFKPERLSQTSRFELLEAPPEAAPVSRQIYKVVLRLMKEYSVGARRLSRRERTGFLYLRTANFIPNMDRTSPAHDIPSPR